MNYHNHTLEELEHIAFRDNHELAIQIITKRENNVDARIEAALDKQYNGANAARVISMMLDIKPEDWVKGSNKDYVTYVASVGQATIQILRNRGTIMWDCGIVCGDVERSFRVAGQGAEQAQEKAIREIIDQMGYGLEVWA